MVDKSYKQYKHKSRFQHLSEVLDKDTVTDALLPIVKQRFGESADISDVGVNHLAKGVFVCDLSISNATRPVETKWSVVAKTIPGKEPLRRAYELMGEFWRNGFSGDAEDGISIPEPYSLVEDIEFMFMELIPGKSLRKLVKEEDADVECMRQFARTLLKMQRCPVRHEGTISLRSEYRRPKNDCSRLMAENPSWEAAIESVIETSLRIEAGLGPDIRTPVHGDYNLGQLFIKGNCCWLLDFGTIRDGDPAWDVANVLTLSLLNGEKPGVANPQAMQEAFQDTYFSEADSAIAERIPLYSAFYLLSRACKYHRTQEPGRVALIDGMIQQASELVERCARGL